LEEEDLLEEAGIDTLRRIAAPTEQVSVEVRGQHRALLLKLSAQQSMHEANIEQLLARHMRDLHSTLASQLNDMSVKLGAGEVVPLSEGVGFDTVRLSCLGQSPGLTPSPPMSKSLVKQPSMDPAQLPRPNSSAGPRPNNGAGPQSPRSPTSARSLGANGGNIAWDVSEAKGANSWWFAKRTGSADGKKLKKSKSNFLRMSSRTFKDDMQQSTSSPRGDSVPRWGRRRSSGLGPELGLSEMRGRMAMGMHSTRSAGQYYVRRLAKHRGFEMFACFLIMANAAIIGWEADYSVKNPGDTRNPAWLEVFEWFFAFGFSVELLVRMIAEGWSFIDRENANLTWNVFDALVILTSWAEKILGQVSEGQNASSLKLLQIFRIVRILRIIRVMRFFKELRVMVQGIAASLKPLLWCIILLCLVMFSFGVCIDQVVAQYLPSASEEERRELLRYFGGIMNTIYTLYACIIGGIDWDTAARWLFDINPAMPFLFSAYIAFAVLCMLNIVTGVFVEHANAITKSDADNMVMEELLLQEKRLEEMRTIFERMSGGEGEELHGDQFRRFAQNEKVQAYFRRIGLSVDNDNAHALFALIDMDNDGIVSLEEFVTGCMQFIGTARQLDIARLRSDYEELRRAVAPSPRAEGSGRIRKGVEGVPSLERAPVLMKSHSMRS